MRRQDGFTLIEVLVALVVTVSALVIIAQGFMTGARASVVAQNDTQAALLAQQVLTDFETGALSLSSSTSKQFEEVPGFSYTASSEAFDTGVSKLTITVKWEERNEERTYVLVRLMRERPTP